MAFIIFFLLLLKKFEKVEKTGFFRANPQISNLNVLHKGLLMQDWVFRLGLLLYVIGLEINYTNNLTLFHIVTA